MFSDGSLRALNRVVPRDFAGRYAFYDDGWPGALTLFYERVGGLRAAYHSYRYASDYEVTAVVDDHHPHQITITIHEFNEMGRQVFTGYLFTRSKNVIVGWTEWKGTPFGFLARKARPRLLNSPMTGQVQPKDFEGRYSFYCDGDSATLTLRRIGSRELAGTLSEHKGADLAVSALVDPEVPHKFTGIVEGIKREPGRPPIITGFLFSWSRDVIAGSIEWAGTHLACYAAKFSQA